MNTDAETGAAQGCTPPQPDDAQANDALARFLAGLDAAKHEAAVAETTFRRDAAARIEALANARAYAHRRADLMASLAASVRDAASAEIAVAAAQALLRARLGWDDDSEARTDVLTRFAPVAVALHDATVSPADPADALATFEDWYLSTRQSPFWYLFEHYMTDTPLVDF